MAYTLWITHSEVSFWNSCPWNLATSCLCVWWGQHLITGKCGRVVIKWHKIPKTHGPASHRGRWFGACLESHGYKMTYLDFCVILGAKTFFPVRSESHDSIIFIRNVGSLWKMGVSTETLYSFLSLSKTSFLIQKKGWECSVHITL